MRPRLPGGAGASIQWDVGDGRASAQANPVHIYARDGLYKVVLRATRGDETDVFTRYISVGSPTYRIYVPAVRR